MVEQLQPFATRCVKDFRIHHVSLDAATRFSSYRNHDVNLLQSILNLSSEEFLEVGTAVNLRGHCFNVPQPRFHLARMKLIYIFNRPEYGIDTPPSLDIVHIYSGSIFSEYP